jgi:membrane protease subunit (stomatin/prohibitin family)
MKLFAADYPFLDIFWTMILFFFWVAWIWILITIIGDLFRRDDTSGWAKAGWTIFLGVLIYLIVNSKGMAERNMQRAQADQAQFADYVQSVAATSPQSGGPAAEIGQAKTLLDSGAINQQEYDAIKAKALA